MLAEARHDGGPHLGLGLQLLLTLGLVLILLEDDGAVGYSVLDKGAVATCRGSRDDDGYCLGVGEDTIYLLLQLVLESVRDRRVNNDSLS